MPFEVLASGPLGDGLEVAYYAGATRLKQVGGSAYRPVLEGLPPGLHALYAVTTVGGAREVSRPVLIFFGKRPT